METIQSNRSVNGSDSLGETFKALIHRIPESEVEAEWIVTIVEKLMSEHPSLHQYLEPDQGEELSSGVRAGGGRGPARFSG